MSLEAGRVGVRPDQVDAYGRINPNTSFLDKIIDKLITWVDLPVWKGGTEQLLPENDDEPETSPILCDIDYPDQERKDQYFTYRESPTGSDGIAKIESIRGNTLVWNQILYDGNFTSASNWTAGTNASITVANNQIDAVPIDSGTAENRFFRTNGTYAFNSTHTYLFFADAKGDTSFTFQITRTNPWGVLVTKEFSVLSSFGKVYDTFTPSENADCSIRFIFDSKTSLSMKNANIIDLTLLGDSNITNYTSFSSMFQLPYYVYDTGSLLNFTGNKIRTIGKNLFYLTLARLKTFNSTGTWTDNKYALNGLTFEVKTDENDNVYEVVVNGTASATTYLLYSDTNNLTGELAKNILGRTVILNGCPAHTGNPYTQMINTWGTTSAVYDNGSVTAEISIPMQINGLRIQIEVYSGNTLTNVVFKPMLRLADVSDANYEHYVTNTLELPISDFFPTGMKSAGEVYDELLPRRATTNIGAVDLGSLTYNYSETRYWFSCANVTSLLNMKLPANNQSTINGLSAIYSMNTRDTLFGDTTIDMQIAVNQSTDTLLVRNLSYTSVSDFKTAMSGVMLNYELAQPIVEPTLVFND